MAGTVFSKETFSHLGLLILRISIGAQLAWLHGLGKLRGFSAAAATFPDPLNIGHRHSLMGTIAGELLCAGLLAIGLGTRLAAAGTAFTLGVAAFIVQGHDSWARRELALLYFAGALAVCLLGPGKLSADATILPKLLRRGGSKAKSSVRFGKPARA